MFPTVQRQPIGRNDLEIAIDQQLNTLTSSAMVFTAYTITLLLRRALPHIEIVHDEVRDYVHYSMDNVAGYKSSDEQWISPDGNPRTAKTFSPSIQLAPTTYQQLASGSVILSWGDDDND